MKSINYSAGELNWNQRMWRSSREVEEDRGGFEGNGDFTQRRVGKERRGFGAGGLQGREFGEINGQRGRKRQEEAGRWRQVMAEMAEKEGREHLLQCSGSQGVGGWCW